MRNEVADALTLWKPDDVRIEKDVVIEGETETHRLNFVGYASAPTHRTAAVDVLPSSHSLDKAYRYGFTRLDMEKKSDEYKGWGRLAVMPKVEAWSGPALDLIRRIATDTLELESHRDYIRSEVEALIADKMSKAIERPRA
jgi:hypothetical protein